MRTTDHQLAELLLLVELSAPKLFVVEFPDVRLGGGRRRRIRYHNGSE